MHPDLLALPMYGIPLWGVPAYSIPMGEGDEGGGEEDSAPPILRLRVGTTTDRRDDMMMLRTRTY